MGEFFYVIFLLVSRLAISKGLGLVSYFVKNHPFVLF